MKVLGIVGKSGSGKTTLVGHLTAELTARGFTVSTIKYAKDGVDLDKPGKDSYLHRQSGAREVGVVTPNRWALLHENSGKLVPPPIDDLIAAMSPVDVLLIEGLRDPDYDCIEIQRAGNSSQSSELPRKIAIVSDVRDKESSIPVLDIDAPQAICSFLLRYWGLHEGTLVHPIGSNASSSLG